MALKRKNHELSLKDETLDLILGKDVMNHIFSFLDWKTVVVCKFVSKWWLKLALKRKFKGHLTGQEFIDGGSDQIVDWLRNSHCPPGNTMRMIYIALKCDVAKGIQWAHEAGKNLDWASVFNCAIIDKKINIAKWIIQERYLEFPEKSQIGSSVDKVPGTTARMTSDEIGDYKIMIQEIEICIARENERKTLEKPNPEMSAKEWAQKVSNDETEADKRYCAKRLATLLSMLPDTTIILEMLMIFGDEKSLLCIKRHGFPLTQSFYRSSAKERVKTFLLRAKFHYPRLGGNEVVVFVERGHLSIVKHICEITGWNFKMDIWDEILTAAFRGGNKEMVDFLYSHRSNVKIKLERNVFSGNIRLFSGSQIFEWMMTNMGELAIKHDQLDLFKKILKDHPSLDGRFIDTAASFGKTDFVEYMWNNGTSKTEDVITNAVYHSHIALAKWARERGCPWSAKAPHAALVNNDGLTFAWLIENGCPWDKETLSVAIARKSWLIFNYMLKKGGTFNKDKMLQIVKDGDLKTLKIAHKHGWKIDSLALGEAISCGNFHMVKWMLSQGYCIMTSEMMAAAIQRPTSDMGLLLMKYGCKFDFLRFRYALSKKMFRLTRKAVEMGGSFIAELRNEIAKEGNIEKMDLLIKGGVPMCVEMFTYSMNYERNEMIEWLIKNNCPIK